ncbi:MAG: hypothetical protein AAFN93_21870, partial [Bacteroidota bacterium]
EDENVQKYFQLAETLEEQYPQLDFRNHCYWRIALDNVLQGKWEILLDVFVFCHPYKSSSSSSDMVSSISSDATINFTILSSSLI